jgi:hypothetical protein
LASPIPLFDHKKRDSKGEVGNENTSPASFKGGATYQFNYFLTPWILILRRNLVSLIIPIFIDKIIVLTS